MFHLDPGLGLSVLSACAPFVDASNHVVIALTTPHPTLGNPPYLVLLLVKLVLLCGWFAERLQHYVHLAQEIYTEACEERRLRSFSESLPDSDPYKSHSQSALTTFHLFPCLPPELRHMIWTAALPDARLLMLTILPPPPTHPFRTILPHNQHNSPRSGKKKPKPRYYTFRCSTPPPLLLSVTSESRAVTLLHYRLSLAPEGHPEPRIYVDFKRDVICLPDSVMDCYAGQNLARLTPDLAKVKRLCVPWGHTSDEFLAMRPMAKMLEGVEEVVVVDSALIKNGFVPPVAGLDWEYWVGWRSTQGMVGWRVKRERRKRRRSGREWGSSGETVTYFKGGTTYYRMPKPWRWAWDW